MEENVRISVENICPYVRNVGSGNIDWQGRMRKIYDYELMYFISGKGVYRLNDEKYSISEGSMLLIKPNIAHTLVLDGEYEYIWIHFDFFYRDDVNKLYEHVKNNLNELFQDCLPHTEWIREQPKFDDNFLFPDYIKLQEKEVIEVLFRKLLFEHLSKGNVYKLRCKALLLDIFAEVMKQILENGEVKTNYSNFKVFHKLISFIEQNYFKRLSLADLANVVGLSGDYISRIFKEKTNYSAIEYLNYYRIKKAKSLLMHEDLKITDIAGMVGFESLHYFSRMFKKYEGVSPRKFCKLR